MEPAIEAERIPAIKEFNIGNDKYIFREAVEVDFQSWISAFQKIFPDDYDESGTNDVILNDFKHRDDSPDGILRKFYLIEKDNEIVAIRWARIKPGKQFEDATIEESGAAYVLYGGVIPEKRNIGIYPRIIKFSEDEFREQHVGFVTAECENPGDSDVFVNEDEKINSERRINFFERNGYHFFIMQYHTPDYWSYPDNEEWMEKSTTHYLLGLKFLTSIPIDFHLREMQIVGMGINMVKQIYLKQITLVLSGKTGVPIENIKVIKEGMDIISKFDKFVPFMKPYNISESGSADDE